jgi:integrase
MATCLSIVLNTAIRHEAILANPVSQLQRKTEKPRRVKWSKDDVKTFLTTAYSEWRWRSIGLILHMAYEWGQRIGDMRLLKWEDIDFEAQRVDITQSKRGAEVHLPVPDELLAMLEAQRVDFGFQDYVAPRVKPNHSGYSPYTAIEIHTQVNNIKAKAGLDPKLQARDLRRTAITEMAEAGVDLVGIMQVSGHQNPNSVKPYLVNTFSGASAALSKRKGNE